MLPSVFQSSGQVQLHYVFLQACPIPSVEKIREVRYYMFYYTVTLPCACPTSFWLSKVGCLRRKFVLLHACCRAHAKLEDAIGKVSCVHGTLQALHFWLWHRGRPTCILCAAFPSLVCITLVSEAEMFQPHELLREPKEVAASHKHCLELAPAQIRVLAACSESWPVLLNGRFVWSSAAVVGGCR